MNLQQLTTFCTVLAEGSMTAAAEKLFLTQPAVSQQIRNLEEEMGVDLLVRGVRQLKPTLQGQILYDYAKRILHLTQQAQVAIQNDVAGGDWTPEGGHLEFDRALSRLANHWDVFKAQFQAAN